MAALICNNCQTPLDVDVKPPRIMHMPHTVLVVVEHCGEMLCPTCNQIVIPAIVALQGMHLAMMPVPASRATPGVLPIAKKAVVVPKNEERKILEP